MPTFTERMFWGQGDAQDLAVFDTDIGRLGGLICGEHLMTLMRAAMVGLGEDIHVAVFPGAFALHTGPRLEEWDATHHLLGPRLGARPRVGGRRIRRYPPAARSTKPIFPTTFPTRAA